MTVDELYDAIKSALENGGLDGSEEVAVIHDDSDGDLVYGAWLGGIVKLADYEEPEQHALIIGYGNRPAWKFQDQEPWQPGDPVPEGFRVWDGDGESGPCYPTLIPIDEN